MRAKIARLLLMLLRSLIGKEEASVNEMDICEGIRVCQDCVVPYGKIMVFRSFLGINMDVSTSSCFFL